MKYRFKHSPGVPAGALGLLVLASVVLVAACAGPRAPGMEPLLTHPPNYEDWSGAEPAPAENAPVAGSRYEGLFRLPLAEEWSWELPDDGHWALSRLELGTAETDDQHVLVGSSRSPGLFVLERNSGRLVLEVEMDGPVQAQPLRLEDGGWVVADTFGNVQRLDASFKPVWDTAYGSGGAVYRSPVVLADRVIVSTGADTVAAVHLETGKWLWSFKKEVPRGSLELAILGAPSPALVGEDIVIGFSDGSVSGLDPASGRERWSVQVGSGKFPDIQSEALSHEGLIFVGAFGGPVVALDAQSREVRWRNESSGATSPMLLVGDLLYTTDVAGRLLCLDSATGKQVWAWEYKEAQFGSPVRAGGSILVGDNGGSLHAIGRFEGDPQWRYQPSDGTHLAGVAAPVLVAGRQVLFTSSGGTIRSLIAEPGVGEDDAEEPRNRGDRVFGW